MRLYHLLALLAPALCAVAQPSGTLAGKVVLDGPETPLHHATVLITPLGRSVETGDAGEYEFRDVPAGTYEVVAHMHSFTEVAHTVEIPAGGSVVLDFRLKLAPVRQQVTVTASGREQTALETYQAITSIDSLDLAKKGAESLGEILESEPGIAKRSFGPGTTRPVVRGFDGDRVLILQDGMRTGTLSSQSGDHGEPLDATTLERLEVVRGPATLLYGSSAIGGVVNAITGHHQIHPHAHEGVRGYLTANAGSANAQGGGSGGIEYGWKKWLFWADGGGHRTGDYATPAGRVPNSKTRFERGFGGFAHYGDKLVSNAAYGYESGRYGVPYASAFEEDSSGDPVDLAFRRHHARGTATVNELSPVFERFELALNYTDWNHRELRNEAVGTQFFNRQFTYRGLLEQRPAGRLSGSLGIWGLHRSYKALGEETLSAPVDQSGVAIFGLEEVRTERVRVQFGGRVERNAYMPEGLVKRSFTGVSAATGTNIGLWRNAALALNYARSYRAPALEELYNNGPHTGNLTYEIGNPNLTREVGNSFDASLRHDAGRMRAELNAFCYLLNDFVYLAPTGRLHGGLIEADYFQANARYKGLEAQGSYRAHPDVWLNAAVDAVDARLRGSNTPLPRIPPVRGRLSVDARFKSLSVRPELVLSRTQRKIFPTETPTPGYALLNFDASYTIAAQHSVQVISLTLFNATDRLYRNHLSFIKDLAPEIGRGVRLTYTIRFF